MRLKRWFPLPLAALALAAGYALARLDRGGDGEDMIDALKAVQSRSPRFLISERSPTGGWARTGMAYLCREERTPDEILHLSRYPFHADPRWAGVVCFRGTVTADVAYIPWVSDGGHCCVAYATFAVYGDPELLAEVAAILDAAGFRRRGEAL